MDRYTLLWIRRVVICRDSQKGEATERTVQIYMPRISCALVCNHSKNQGVEIPSTGLKASSESYVCTGTEQHISASDDLPAAGQE